MAESREFRTMLETKERELVALCDQQIQSLNSQIREKESAVTELKDQISQLQDDFKYNLGLLDARDAELAQYDVSSAALEASVTESDERVKVARKALADAETLRVQVLIIPKFIAIQSIICFPEHATSSIKLATITGI